MKLTCVTAVFNAVKSGNRERLIRCVKSVAALKTEHEHLIYDGASIDGTVELLRELEKKTLGLKVVSEPDEGVYDALNKGVRDARGEWLYVLGCDDYLVHPDVMDATIEANDDGVDMSVSTVERDNGTRYFTSPECMRSFFLVNCYSHQGVLLRAKWARAFGGFAKDNPISADYDMLLKAHRAALNIRYIFEPFACYAIGGLSANQTKNEKYDIPVFCRHLQLTPEQAANRWTKSFPIRKMLPFIFHKDLMLRTASRHMVCWRARRYLCAVFRPLLILKHLFLGSRKTERCMV